MSYSDPSPKLGDSDNNLLQKICQILNNGSGGGGGGGVTSFNTRVGAVTLVSADVTVALGFTPAPNTPSYLVLAADATLLNERVLTGTANQVILTDNGAGSSLVLSLPQSIAAASTPTFGGLTLTGPLVGGNVAPDSASYVTLAVNATLTNERVLTGTANQVILTDNGAGSTIVLSLPQSIAAASTPTFAGLTLTGALLFTADNTIDIGAAGANRPRTGYFGTSVITPLLTISTTAKLTAPSDGVLLLTDNAATSFARLQLGGTTSSFPSIKRNAAALNFRLADDSADAAITAAAATLSGQLIVTRGTLTANAPSISITETWNNAGVTFTGILSNITDTTSAAASLLLDLQVAGSSKLNVSKLGVVTTNANGSTSAPAIVFGGRGTNWGIASIGASNISIIVAGTEVLRFSSDGSFTTPNDTAIFGWTTDTKVTKDVANVWAFRNTTNPTSIRAYNTFTSSTNFERLDVQWATNVCQIWTEKGSGGGTARVLVLGADATELLRFDTGSKLSFFAATTVVKQTSGENLTNNVTAGGTDGTVANFTDLVIYANDAAAIRNDIYQLSRKLKQINDGLRSYGLFT